MTVIGSETPYGLGHRSGRRPYSESVQGASTQVQHGDRWVYEFLGIEPDASEPHIAKAYRRLAKVMHPDRGGTDDAMARLNRAHDVALRYARSR